MGSRDKRTEEMIAQTMEEAMRGILDDLNKPETFRRMDDRDEVVRRKSSGRKSADQGTPRENFEAAAISKPVTYGRDAVSGKRRPKKRPQMRFMKKDPVKRFRKRLQTLRRKGSRVRKILTGLMYLLMKVFLDQAA